VTEVVTRVAVAARAGAPLDRALRRGLGLTRTARTSRSFQDWRGWLDAKLLDFAVPNGVHDRRTACCATSPRRRSAASAATASGSGSARGSFASDPARARARKRDAALALHPKGISLFSYDAIADAPALRAALVVAP
jgi:hypothetical protein